MVRLRLRFFAAPRDAVGAGEIPFTLPEGGTVGDLLESLYREYPALKRWKGHVLVSVNREFADLETTVADGDEVAFMPPVSGGAKGEARIQDAPFSVDDALARLDREGAGAAVAFLGMVRPTSAERPGARVERLEFDAYREMADRELGRVREAAREKFGLVDATILHRVGTLALGEDIVLVVVTAPHREEAFEAARWIMNELKTVVPVWKKEVGPEGERWVNDAR